MEQVHVTESELRPETTAAAPSPDAGATRRAGGLRRPGALPVLTVALVLPLLLAGGWG